MRHPLQARTSAAHSNLHQGWGLTIMASAAFLQPLLTCSTWPGQGHLPDAARVPLQATEPALPLLRLGRGSNGRYPPPPPSHRPRQPARPARPTAPLAARGARPTADPRAANAIARDALPLRPPRPRGCFSDPWRSNTHRDSATAARPARVVRSRSQPFPQPAARPCSQPTVPSTRPHASLLPSRTRQPLV